MTPDGIDILATEFVPASWVSFLGFNATTTKMELKRLAIMESASQTDD